MSRRRDGGRDNSMTGANAIPLGPRKGGSGGGGGTMKRGFVSPPRELQQQLQQQQYQQILSDRPNMPVKSMASESAAAALKAAQAAAANLAKLAQLNKNHAAAAAAAAAAQNDGAGDRGRPRKKKSRWGDEETKAFIPGMPATMPSNLTPEQEKAYIVQLQIEDITRKIKSGDYGIPINPEDRSPSPEPIYNGEGKRMNTREYRTRKRLEEERHRLILQMKTLNPEYAPPSDYKPMLQRVSERVAIPADVNPNINFVGLLIGPRGNTLKKIEKECNCKIMIRGKGSVKEGKVLRKDGQPLPGEDEPLHALVSSTALENVQKAVQQIREIIKSGIEQPEEENDLRKLQLMELAKLNGTLREDMVPKERAWLRPENQNITNTTVCTKCGGRGHIAQDCMSSQPSMGLQQQMQGGENVDRAKMDSEYMSLMAELGEGPPPSSNNNQQNGSGPGLDQNGRKTLMANPPFNNYGGRGARGGPRPPWMSGPPRGPPPNFNQGGRGGPRYGSRGGFGNRGPPMGGGRGGGGPPPWSQPPPYGGSGGPPPWGGPPPPQSSGGRGGMRPQYGGQGGGQGYGGGGGQSYGGGGGGQSYNRDNGSNYGQGGGGQSYNNDNSGGGGGYGNMPPPPPNQGGMGDSGNAPPWSQNQNYGGGRNMYGGGMNNNGGGGPPPPMYGGGQGGNNYLNQPPPPPPSSTPQPPPPPSSGDVPPWQQSSSGSDNNSSSTGTNSMASMYGSNMWGMPPMPVGPGPVPPPPPSGQDNSNSGQSGGMDYSAMYGMSQAPPPPPPPQTQ